MTQGNFPHFLRNLMGLQTSARQNKAGAQICTNILKAGMLHMLPIEHVIKESVI